MKNKTPEPGGICQSIQGRDLGRYYIINKVVDERFILVVDGNYKRLAMPKKKSVKHVRLLQDKAESIAIKFALEKQVFDSEIYSALRPYNEAKPDLESAEADENK